MLYCVQECFGRYSRATIILAQSFCGILREGSRSARALTALAAFVFACLLPVFAAAQSDGLPSAPTGLRTNAPTSNAITIIWVPTWRGADAYFEYRVDSGSWTKVANSDDSYSSVRILDLLPGAYTFGIRAVNAQGPGPVSTVTGTVRGPTSVPGGLRIVGTTSTSVGLDWNKVTGATGYEYQQDGGRWVAVLTSDVQVSNLKDGQVYRFRVRATNADGYGPSSPELVVSPSGTEGLRYEPPQSLHVGEQIIPMKPIAINRDNVAVVVEYRLTGGTTLPPGLSLNRETGVISGAPTTLNTNSMRVEVQGDGNNGFDPTTTISFPPVSKAASFSGTLTGAVTEDAAAATATGTVTVNDDDGKNNVQAQTATAGVYGTFSITAAGVWTYSLDNSDRDTNALAGGMIVTEKFVIRADDGTRATVTVTITGANDRPTANAGPDRFAYRNTMVGLVSRNSFDPDADDHLIYSWARKAGDGGPSVTLSNSDRRNAVFTAPNEARGAVLTFVLTVTDKAGASHTDEVIITVEGIPSLDISPTTLPIEEGEDGSYTVVLNTQPSANVTVTVGGTSETAFGQREGDRRRNVGDRSDGQPQQSDLHNGKLGHGADGDGEGGCGRRCGRRRCNADAHSVWRRLRFSEQKPESDDQRRRPGGDHGFTHHPDRRRGRQRHLYGGAEYAAFGQRDGDRRRNVGDRSDGQPRQSDLHNGKLGHAPDGDGERGTGCRRG